MTTPDSAVAEAREAVLRRVAEILPCNSMFTFDTGGMRGPLPKYLDALIAAVTEQELQRRDNNGLELAKALASLSFVIRYCSREFNKDNPLARHLLLVLQNEGPQHDELATLRAQLAASEAGYDDCIQRHTELEIKLEALSAAIRALREIAAWGTSIPLGMTEEQYNARAVRDIKAHALDAAQAVPDGGAA